MTNQIANLTTSEPQNLQHTVVYSLQPETVAIMRDLITKAHGSVEEASMWFGIAQGEPLIMGLDGLIRYAEAYRTRQGESLAHDRVLGVAWLQVLKGYRALLNGDGAVAMERNTATDSKSNGVCESIIWKALELAGFGEEDL